MGGIIYKHYILKALNISLSIFYQAEVWLEIDLAGQLLYNRRSLKRGPFRPAMDHQVNAP
ncbi:hypothetical protein CXK94_03285 [Stutzerimonas stutzeri]|uniref:Uncharacterized protein n=1 Tax=Stutzerimonas stutzeri TaxID=316 RepID=A0A2N8TA33_STUST|nr:hypothetical protein CXK94_03285 [Stutzerimonas stutzeri]